MTKTENGGRKKYPPRGNKTHKHTSPHHHASRAPHAKKGFFGKVSSFMRPGSKAVRIIPLGGLEEIGKNMMAIEYGNDIMIIDVGLQFPEEDMLGVDYVIPDVSYLEKKRKNIRGIVITHGHLDHIGGIAHILQRIGNPPIYGSRLTTALVQGRLKEFALDKSARLHEIKYEDKIKMGVFGVEFFRMNHSIPGCMGIIIRTPVGILLHTGDFKFDYTPAGDDHPADFGRLASIGNEGVLAAFVDSTNATKPGQTMSERVIGQNLDDLIRNTKGRLIIASFSSLINRIQQIVESAVRYNRKVFISGRSMVTNIQIAEKLGYIKSPKGTIRRLGAEVNKLPPDKVLIITTGSQGESMSALTRMAIGEHSHLEIKKGDTVAFSSQPIPGNEFNITNVINNLCNKGAHVITNSCMDIHTSGHAHQEDIKLLYHLVKPKYVIPVHGMIHMRRAQVELAKQVRIPESNVILANNGEVIECTARGVRKTDEKVSVQPIIIDGLGKGDIGTKVIQERQIMANNGVVIIIFRARKQDRTLVGDPDVLSRGFIYLKESQEIASRTQEFASKSYNDAMAKDKNMPMKDVKRFISSSLSHLYRKRLGREPMILPLIVYV